MATISRMLKDADKKSIECLRQCLRQQVVQRLQALRLTRITLDFDGSVQSITRRAEGAAVFFNNKKKGARSHYLLFCTIAQTLQVLVLLQRAGRLSRPGGKLTLTISGNQAVKQKLLGMLDRLTPGSVRNRLKLCNAGVPPPLL